MRKRLMRLAFGALILDRVLKFLALEGMRVSLPPGGWFRFELFRNNGIAFSLPFSGPLLWLLSAIILVVAAWLAYRDFAAGRKTRLDAYLFFSLGAVSNLFDRVMYGFTVDYAIFFRLSAINIADIMIVAGALRLLLSAPKRR